MSHHFRCEQRRHEESRWNHRDRYQNRNQCRCNEYQNSLFQQQQEEEPSFLEKALPYVAVGALGYGVGSSKGDNIGAKTGNFIGGIGKFISGLFSKKPDADGDKEAK